jgi:hypothetical protein
MKTALSANMNDPEAVPYFLWDEPMTVAQFKERLESASVPERTRLIGKLLREARDTDVWSFVRPAEVWEQWDAISPHLGRRRSFWEFLFRRWREEGLLGKR